jgi:hypothetical protein
MDPREAILRAQDRRRRHERVDEGLLQDSAKATSRTRRKKRIAALCDSRHPDAGGVAVRIEVTSPHPFADMRWLLASANIKANGSWRYEKNSDMKKDACRQKQ